MFKTKEITMSAKIHLIILIQIIFFFSNQLLSQGVWEQLADFGGGIRFGTASFTIDEKAYVFGGSNNSVFHNDLWEYDSLTDSWTQKTSMPSGVRSNAIAFSIGNKGYVGCGYGYGSTFYFDFWEYDPSSNTWSQIADYPAESFSGLSAGVGFSIGGKGYVGTGGGWGNVGPSEVTAEFWEYNPTENLWTQKADFAGGARWFAVGFSIGNKGYIGTGRDFQSNYFNDFWEYNPLTDSWTQKADFAGEARSSGICFAIGDKGYIGTGNTDNSIGQNFNDIWEWNKTTNVWIQKANYPGGGGEGIYTGTGFSIGEIGYVGNGGDTEYDSQPDFWQFNPLLTSTIEKELKGINLNLYPNPINNTLRIDIEDFENDLSLKIYDMSGKEIYILESIVNKETTIEIGNLLNGEYILSIFRNKSLIILRKIVKM